MATAVTEKGSVSDARAAARRRVAELRPAPFVLRCGALLIDYSLLVGALVVATLFARAFGGSTRTLGATALLFGYIAVIAIALLNYVALAGLSGRTLGKWATGLRIARFRARDDERSGSRRPIGFARAVVRHVVGYPLSIVTLGLGFLVGVVARDGRALHDRIAGTIVVRD